ncbi:MAG: threonine/serine exporter [Clostridiales bacterium]|jgi:uncharacterized membrane protein YjjB (DUF3815 family)|nr:threonine/serine exporter [Clostridiales bacterium]
MIEVLIQLIGAFTAIAALSVIVSVPKKYLWLTGLIGAWGWGIFLASQYLWESMYLSNFIAATAIALVAQISARIFKLPATTFTIPGMMTLVPGSGMYNTVYYLILGDAALSQKYVIETLLNASSIAIGIFLMGTLFTYAISRRKKNEYDDVI